MMMRAVCCTKCGKTLFKSVGVTVESNHKMQLVIDIHRYGTTVRLNSDDLFTEPFTLEPDKKKPEPEKQAIAENNDELVTLAQGSGAIGLITEEAKEMLRLHEAMPTKRRGRPKKGAAPYARKRAGANGRRKKRS